MNKKNSDEDREKIVKSIDDGLGMSEFKAFNSLVLSQIKTGKEDPKRFLSQLNSHFGYLNENWLDLILFDREMGFGFVNYDISIARANFKEEYHAEWYHIPGQSKKTLEVNIPDIDLTYNGEGLVARRCMGCQPKPMQRIRFKIDSKGKMKHCYFELIALDKNENSGEVETSGSFKIYDTKRFCELVRKVEYVMIGTDISLYSLGTFVGLIAKEGEYFMR